MRRIFFVLILFGASTVLPAAARADPFDDEIAEGAGSRWAYGVRVGAELHVGGVADRPYPLFIPGVGTTTEKLFEGPDFSAFVEYTVNDHVRVGFELGSMISVIGNSDFEKKFVRIAYGPYVRATLHPGRLSPYAVAGGGIYHAIAGGGISELEDLFDVTYSAGGGIEFPITKDFTFIVEGRFRQFRQSGTDPKTVELLLGPHVWFH